MRTGFSTLLVLLMTVWGPAYMQELPTLTGEARVSLLTCGTGNEMYTYFGHSAIRITDPGARVNRVYNYGTFDFTVSNFYLQFAKGKMYYMLSATRSESFMNEYIGENRYIHEVPLLLTDEEKQTLFTLLENNLLPENKHYWYDFFKDNCSTRVRDIIAKSTSNRFSWPGPEQDPLTFRELILPYLKPHPWSRTGILLLLAGGADEKATISDYMFLPERMEDIFVAARDDSGNPLTGEHRVLFSAQETSSRQTPFHPYVIFSLFAAMSLLIAATGKYRTLARIWFSFWFLAAGLLGILFSFMWFVSEHWVCHANLNLAWALPFSLVPAITIWFRSLDRFNRITSITLLIPLILFLLTFPFWKQSIPIEGILIAISVGSGFYYFSGLPNLGNSKPKKQANQ